MDVLKFQQKEKNRMKKESKNRNSLKSKNAIKSAFLELIQIKDVENITVTEIVKKADLNRSTFYQHYYDVYDIVEEIQNNVIDELKNLIHDLDVNKCGDNDFQILDLLSNYLYTNKDLFKICILHQDVLPFLEDLIKLFTDSLLKNPSIIKIDESLDMKKIRISYISGGIVFTYIKWFKDEIDCDIKKLTTTLKEQVKCSLNLL